MQNSISPDYSKIDAPGICGETLFIKSMKDSLVFGLEIIKREILRWGVGSIGWVTKIRQGGGY